MTFQELGLIEPLLRAIVAEGYVTPTSIQQQAIGPVMDGRDLLGCAQTGTGKTAAFALPILHHCARQVGNGSKPQAQASQRKRGRGQGQSSRAIRSLILAPTRELAAQIAASFRAYGQHLPLRTTVVYGGVGQSPQVQALRKGVDVLVATPGRLLDLINQGHIDLGSVEILVLDEADQMLDMGFLPDIRRIVSHLPTKRQTLLFSATMPPDIRALADSILRNPVEIAIGSRIKTALNIDQSVYFVPRKQKPTLLHHLMQGQCIGRTLVFTRTKHGADRVVKALLRGGVEAAAIHGNKSQNARTKALDRFKRPNPPVLVATDIASRGIDVDDVTHVINYDLPNTPEAYVHRIGRTARAGASGSAITFCDRDERSMLRLIERKTGSKLSIVTDLPEAAGILDESADEAEYSRPPKPQRTSRPDATAGKRSAPRGASRKSSPRRRSESGHGSIAEAPQRMARDERKRGGSSQDASKGRSKSSAQSSRGRKFNGRQTAARSRSGR